jgi:hypothetical protein
VVIDPVNGEADIEVLRQDIEEAGDCSSILTFGHPDQRFAQPSGSLGVYGKDASHLLTPFLPLGTIVPPFLRFGGLY